jgi:hypothetical protein
MNICAVSCFYQIKNKHNNNYVNWFKNTLSFQIPYVMFGTKESIQMIQSYRNDITFIECTIDEFETYKYKNNIQTDRFHCPSIELNLVWNEKLFFIEKAKKWNEANGKNYDFYMWIDAGICNYRDKPGIIHNLYKNLEKLPQNKIIVSTSDSPIFYKKHAMYNDSYHYIAGTCYVIHKNFIDIFLEKWRKYTHIILSKTGIYTDQIILTKMYLYEPQLFHILCHGYGEVITSLNN